MSKAEGFIFLCSNETEKECFVMNLFGGGEKYKFQTGNIEIGDKLFLYNYSTKKLHGIYVAESEAQLDLEPNAWEGKYPWQVRFIRQHVYEPLSRTDFENIVSFSSRIYSRSSTLFPQARLSHLQVQDLEKIFQDPQRLPQEESDFRFEFPAEILTADGHKVRSQAEVQIDNWLYYQEVSHGYERKVPIKETLYSDFFIPFSGQKRGVYVEYWGLEDEAYLERKKYKIDLYNKYNLDLISLNLSDLNKLDDVFPLKLRPYFPERFFQ